MLTRVFCATDHDRIQMDYVSSQMTFWCSGCERRVTRHMVTEAIPEHIRPSRDPLGLTLQQLADYDIDVIWDRRGPSIETPRASLRGT